MLGRDQKVIMRFRQWELAVSFACFLRRWKQWNYWDLDAQRHNRARSPEPDDFPRSSVDVIRHHLGADAYRHLSDWLDEHCVQVQLNTLRLSHECTPGIPPETLCDIARFVRWWHRIVEGHACAWQIRDAITAYFNGFASGAITEEVLRAPAAVTAAGAT